MERVETGTRRCEPRSFLSQLGVAIPVVLGYAPVGLAYGVLAGQAGLSVWETLAMSFFVYAGSSQFIGVALWQAAASPVAIIVTTFFVNLRHLLMSAALSPHLKGRSRRWLAFFASQLTDETFAVHSLKLRESAGGGEFYPPAVMLGLNICAHLTWSIASVIGYLAGAQLGDPNRLGLDFALPAMFIALLFMQIRRRLDYLVAILAGGLSLAIPLVLPGRWNTILAAIFAAAVGSWLAGPTTAAVDRGGETHAN